MANFYLPSVLEKMKSSDTDFRYMALNDLLLELEKDTFKLEKKNEDELIPLLLKRLQDISNNVQELAVKCLGPLVTKLKEDNSVRKLIDELSVSILDPKNEDLRDISSIGLKTILTQTPASAAARRQLIASCLTHKLLEGINNIDVAEVKTHCLDVLQELIAQFGSILEKDNKKILQAVLSQLTSTRAATRKRAISALHFLALSVPEDLFADLVKHILSNIQSATRNEQIRSLIQAVTGVSSAAGHRLGKYVGTIMPEILKFVEKSGEEDDELKESCFQAFESLIIRCPTDCGPFVGKVMADSLKYIKHDPNYDAGDGEDDEEADEEEEDWSGEDEDYSDDDDMSWKVRRASAKAMAALIQTYPAKLGVFYTEMGNPIVSRFREREENVKLEVFATFSKLLRATQYALKRGDAEAAPALQALIPKAVGGLSASFKSKSLKTRISAFTLLKDLVSVLNGALTKEFGQLVGPIKLALTDKSSSSALKIEVLVFLRVAFATHTGEAVQPHVAGLLPAICSSASDSYYRISAEGLQVIGRLIPLLRPLEEKTPSFDFKPFVEPIYNATLGQLKQADIDQEVKEAAVNCMALVVSHFGDNLSGAINDTLSILVDRMKNEITRVTAVRGMEVIAASPLKIDLSSVLSSVLSELASYLKKANRSLRQAALQALDTVVTLHGAKGNSNLPAIIAALPDIVDDSDLHLSHLALRLTVSLIALDAELSKEIADAVLPKAEALLRSSLLQGLALESLLNFFAAILQGKRNKHGVPYDDLLQAIVSITPTDLRRSSSGTTLMPRQALSSVAQAVAAITKKAGDKQRESTISRFIKTVKKEDDQEVVLALLSLGEIGRRIDLSGTKHVRETILGAFDAPSEDVKQSASFALGNLAVGNMSVFLPQILDEVQKNPKHQYLVLHSLREVIHRQSSRKSGKKVLVEHIKPILQLLMGNITGEEEGTRNVVAECLGKLTLANADVILPELKKSISHSSANARATVVTSVKFAITEQPQKSDSQLELSAFMALIKDSDVNVRKQTLLTLNFAAHHKPELVRPILADHLPLIYNEAKVNPALIREVDLGPFKHKVDDGLEIRKAAYQCLYTFLENLLGALDMKAFVGQLVHGLSDHADIKMLCQLMLVKLSRYAAPALLEGLNDIVEPLRTTITFKVKEGAVSSDVERNEEIVRSALRAIAAISRMPNIEQAAKFEDLVKTCSEGDLGQKYKTVLAESDEDLLK